MAAAPATLAEIQTDPPESRRQPVFLVLYIAEGCYYGERAMRQSLNTNELFASWLRRPSLGRRKGEENAERYLWAGIWVKLALSTRIRR